MMVLLGISDNLLFFNSSLLLIYVIRAIFQVILKYKQISEIWLRKLSELSSPKYFIHPGEVYTQRTVV